MSEHKLSITEYRKIKEDEHTSSILEEEDDPSLQVDYEFSDSSPNVSPRESNPSGDVLSEEKTTKDSTNTFSGVSNTEKTSSKVEEPFISTYIPWRIPRKETSGEVSLSESGGITNVNSPETHTSLDNKKLVEGTKTEEVLEENFYSEWPWRLERLRHRKFINLEGSPSLPGYGDARGFRLNSQQDPKPWYLSAEDPVKAKDIYFQNSFWESKFLPRCVEGAVASKAEEEN